MDFEYRFWVFVALVPGGGKGSTHGGIRVYGVSGLQKG
jgi:hypothetical protein